MPSLSIDIEVRDRQVLAALRELEERGRRLRPALADIGEMLRFATEERFRLERDPEGRPWAPLKPEVRKRKRGTKILTESGLLRDSIAPNVGNDEAALGTNKVYGAIHQFGGKTRPHVIRPKRKKALYWPGAGHPRKIVHHPGSDIPARPYLGVSDEDRREVLAIPRDHLLGT